MKRILMLWVDRGGAGRINSYTTRCWMGRKSKSALEGSAYSGGCQTDTRRMGARSCKEIDGRSAGSNGKVAVDIDNLKLSA